MRGSGSGINLTLKSQMKHGSYVSDVNLTTKMETDGGTGPPKRLKLDSNGKEITNRSQYHQLSIQFTLASIFIHAFFSTF